ncbi:MAG: ankyrin repeat domain-containing protein [Candidatus Hermodarchaeia archaeon]|jgi:ankyrin repeat protein
METKYKTYPILEVLLLVLWVSSHSAALPDFTDSHQKAAQSMDSVFNAQRSSMDDICDLIFTGETVGDCAHSTNTGDIDGDGYTDLIIGAQLYNGEQGRVYLYYGGPNMDANADLIFEGDKGATSRFGWLLGVGDVDNDNYDDIIVGAHQYNNTTGRAYLYYGNTRANMDTTCDLTFDGETAGDHFGAGWNDIICEDIDGDSYDDIIIPAPNYNSGQGRVYLYWGDTKSSMNATCDLIFIPEAAAAQYGMGMGCGDIDNDGYKDIVIGAIYYPDNSHYGRAYLYWSDNKSNMDTVCDLIFEAESADTHDFGCNVGIADIDNDNYDDVVIGAYLYGNRKGRAYLYWGNTKANMDTNCDLTFTGETARSGFAELCISRGDVNADGYADILIGAHSYDNNRGRAYLFFGDTKSYMHTNPDLILTGENEGDWFGDPPGGSFSDFNNDGYDDIVVGARMYPGGDETGRVYLYYGGPQSKGKRIALEREEKLAKTLHQAAAGGVVNRVKLLISQGADVNAKDEQARTPLHCAVLGDRKNVAELLISKGADVNSKDNDGQTPVEFAVRGNHKEVVKLLIAKGAKISLNVAAYVGDLAKVKSFIENGTPVNIADKTGFTPLHAAIGSGRKDIVEFLIGRGANVNANDEKNRTPLDYAVSEGYKNVAEYLIAKGANINPSQVEKRWPPLHSAVYERHKDIAELLIAKGASVNAVDVSGYTPLHYAVCSKDKNSIKLLVKKGADVNIAPKNSFPPLLYTVWSDDIDTVKLLVAHGAKFDMKDRDGMTALHITVRLGNKEMAEFLIAKGADVNAKNNRGRTPLHLAAWYSPNIVELLVSNGADVNVKDKDGKTPLSLAVEEGHTEIVELLRKHGAKD